jgi:hypothetical protein
MRPRAVPGQAQNFCQARAGRAIFHFFSRRYPITQRDFNASGVQRSGAGTARPLAPSSTLHALALGY